MDEEKTSSVVFSLSSNRVNNSSHMALIALSAFYSVFTFPMIDIDFTTVFEFL